MRVSLGTEPETTNAALMRRGVRRDDGVCTTETGASNMRNNNQPDENFNSLALALAYLERHLYSRYIFPITAGKKFPPCLKDNLDSNSSNDPERIKQWSKKFPGCNWGVAHAKSKLLVVDVDTNEAKGKVGQQTYDALGLAYDWPDTETTTTPSGGFHKIYKAWSDERHPAHIMAIGENGLGKNIDSPNYTLIPGCTFKDGTSYVGNGADAVKCPAWIYDVILTAKQRGRERIGLASRGEVVVGEIDSAVNAASAIDYLQNDADPAVQGQGGDNATYRAACYLKDLGISIQRGAELMNEWYNPRCVPPWDLDDLVKKMESAYSYGSLSKVGGKTAEADFADDEVEPFEPMGDPAKIEEQRTKRARDKAEGKKPEPSSEGTMPWDRQCGIIVKPAAFVDLKRAQLLSAKSFDNRFGMYGAEVNRKAIKSKKIKRYHGIGYRPGAGRSFRKDGQLIFNQYRPQKIEPLDGEPTIFLEHVAYLIPDQKSREAFLNWLAWIVQYPDRKLMHAVLLLGKKGTGKSWFAELMKVILGAHNCSEPSKRRVASDFNGWLANKMFVTIHELREKGARGLYDELKEVITQGSVSINLKGIEAYEVESFAAILTITNHEDAIPIDDNERRYLVIRCADAPAFGKGTPASDEYYKTLFDCIGTSDEPSDEARRVLAYLRARDLAGYNGQGPAPETQAKADMVEASLNGVERFVREKRQAREWPLGSPIVSPHDVLEALPFEIGLGLRTDRTVEAALREIGARPLSDFGQLRTVKGRRRLWAINGEKLATIYRTKTRRQVTAMYDRAVAERDKVEREADAREAAAEMLAS
jgi:hypothetical protein